MLCWLCVRPHGSVALRLTELSALQEYEEDVREFKLKVDDTERRLGAVFCQAFEDASGLEHAFKVGEQNPSLFLSLSDIHRDILTCIEGPFSYLMSAGPGYVR